MQGYGTSLLKAPLKAVEAVNKALRRDDYPPSMRAALAKYGDQKIVKLTAGRNPIVSTIQKIANTLIGDKMKDVNIDTLFHLFLIVELENGMKFKTERNQVLNFTSSIGEVKESESVPVSKNVTLAEFFDNTFKRYGKALFQYSAATNNCQSYLIQLLNANGLLNSKLQSFIKQNTQTLLSPFLKKVTDTITDVAASADTIMNGKGCGCQHGGGEFQGVYCRF